MRCPRAPRNSADPTAGPGERRRAPAQPGAAARRPRARRTAPSVPCVPCRSTRTTRRSVVEVVDVETDAARRPGCRWRTAAPGSRRRARRSARPRPHAHSACSISDDGLRRCERVGQRPVRLRACPAALPASVGSRPVACAQAVNTRAAVARRAIVVRDRPQRLLLGQPAAQRPEIDAPSSVAQPEPLEMSQQVADVAAVGTDRVLGQPTLGSQVALVGSEQRGVLLAELVVAAPPRAVIRFTALAVRAARSRDLTAGPASDVDRVDEARSGRRLPSPPAAGARLDHPAVGTEPSRHGVTSAVVSPAVRGDRRGRRRPYARHGVEHLACSRGPTGRGDAPAPHVGEQARSRSASRCSTTSAAAVTRSAVPAGAARAHRPTPSR